MAGTAETEPCRFCGHLAFRASQTAGNGSATAAGSDAPATGKEKGDEKDAVASDGIGKHLSTEVLLGVLKNGWVDLTSGDANDMLNEG